MVLPVSLLRIEDWYFLITRASASSLRRWELDNPSTTLCYARDVTNTCHRRITSHCNFSAHPLPPPRLLELGHAGLSALWLPSRRPLVAGAGHHSRQHHDVAYDQARLAFTP